MDNLRKRDYANFNNGNRDNVRCSSRDSYGNVRSDNRNRYNARDIRENNVNRSNSDRNRDSMKKNVQVQYSNRPNNNNRPRGNSNNRLINAYENISNTVQKKFNNSLYKGGKNGNNVKNENNSAKLEEESQINVPKSVFIFITIAVIFATGLVVLLTQPSDSSKSLVSNNKKDSKEVVKQNGEEDGFQTYAEISEEKLQEKLDELEDSVTSDETENSQTSENRTTDTDNKKTTPSKLAQSDSNSNKTSVQGSSNTTTGNSNDTQYSTTNKNSTINTNVPRATIKPDSDDEEDDEELIDDSSDEGTFTLPCSIPAQGGLYRCVYSYASVGSDGRFVKYTNYVNEPYGASIQKKDLNGMWLVSKGLALSESSVSNVYAYRNGIRVDVCKITIYVNRTTKKRCMYAIKDTVVPFTDGSYKIKGTSSYITSLTVTKDVTLVEY